MRTHTFHLGLPAQIVDSSPRYFSERSNEWQICCTYASSLWPNECRRHACIRHNRWAQGRPVTQWVALECEFFFIVAIATRNITRTKRPTARLLCQCPSRTRLWPPWFQLVHRNAVRSMIMSIFIIMFTTMWPHTTGPSNSTGIIYTSKNNYKQTSVLQPLCQHGVPILRLAMKCGCGIARQSKSNVCKVNGCKHLVK